MLLRLRRRLGQPGRDGLQLERNAGKPLREGVVQFAGDAVALRQHERELRASLLHAVSVKTPARNNGEQPAQRIEPGSLVEMRGQREGERGACLVPYPVLVASDHVKSVVARR